MAEFVVQYSRGMLLLLICLAVGFAGAYLHAAFRSMRSRKSRAAPSTPPSDARFAKIEAEMAELFLILEKLTTMVKRVSSREAMAQRRAEPGGDPPQGTPKAQLLKHYGMVGKVGTDFAREQLKREQGSN